MAHATAQQLPPPRLHFQVQWSATGDHVVVSAYDILGRDVGHIQAGELGLRGAQTRWDIAGGQGQARGFVACARQVEDLRARGYEPTEAWAVFSAMLQSEFHGRGLGVQLYDALLKAIAARAKGTVFIGPEACWTGTTSDAAGRVWDSLARRYPSSGRILVLEPRAGNPPRRGAKRVNVDGLVAWASPVRATNPSQVEHEQRARELVRDGDAKYLSALRAHTNESTLEHLMASISAYTAALQELSWVRLGGVRKTRQMVQIRLDNAQANLINGWMTQPIPRRLAKRMRQYILDGKIPEKPGNFQLRDFPAPAPKLRIIRGGRENPGCPAARNPSASMSQREYTDLLESLNRDFRRARPMLSALPLLGAGTQRSTYRLDVDGYEPTALKVCDDHACGQMQVEIQCMREAASPLVPALYDYGPPEDPRWAEIELLSPMTPSDFERATGLTWERSISSPWYESPWTFTHALETVICDNRGECDKAGWSSGFGAEQRRMFSDLAMRGSARPGATRKFIQQFMDVVRSCRLDPEELLVLQNWGVNAKGQIKIADLGYPSGVQFNPGAASDRQQLADAFRRIASHPWVVEHCTRTGCRSLTEGGCLAFARALQQWLGDGELVVLLAGPVPFHVVVEHRGVIYDVEGPTDRDALLRRWTPRIRDCVGDVDVSLAPWQQVARHAAIMPWEGLQRSILELLEAELGPASSAHDNPANRDLRTEALRW